jgi:hypothetical protein
VRGALEAIGAFGDRELIPVEMFLGSVDGR